MSEGRDGPLADLKVLVVEDETAISFLLEDMLLELGCPIVWHAGCVNEALTILGSRRPDLAVLDVNLAGEPAYPVAERLAAAAIPFVFATGYGRHGIPETWAPRPVVQKPFSLQSLAVALGAVLKA